MLEAVGRVSEEKGSKAFCSYHQSQILEIKGISQEKWGMGVDRVKEKGRSQDPIRYDFK